jgi:hypothetical protein
LQKRTAELQNVQVIPSAVAGSPGPGVLYRYNLPGASSLHPATGLLQLFPGLREVDQIAVDAVAPTTLLQPLELAPHGEKLLVIDLPGEEIPVLAALWEANALQLFNQLKLRCGREPLYEGCVPAAQVLHWLEEHGFSLLSEDESEDPDYPCWTLQRNVLQLRNLELTDQVAELQRQLTGLQEQLTQFDQARDEQAKLAADRQAQLDTLRQERDAATRELAEQKTQLEQASQAKAGQEKLANDRHAQIQQLTQARDEQAKLAADRQAQLDTLRQERDAATRELAEQKTQLEQANHAKAAQEKLATDRQAQIQQLTQARDEQAKLAGDRQAQLDTLHQERDAATKHLAEQKTMSESKQAEIDRLLASLQTERTRSGQLDAQVTDLEMRHNLVKEEMLKAEGQIELIKDLLLRESGL